MKALQRNIIVRYDGYPRTLNEKRLHEDEVKKIVDYHLATLKEDLRVSGYQLLISGKPNETND